MFGGLESYLEEAHSVASLLAGLYSSIKKCLDSSWTDSGQGLPFQLVGYMSAKAGVGSKKPIDAVSCAESRIAGG